MPIDDPESALLRRLQGGDASAVADLGTTYGSRIGRIAFRYLKNREDAEEVVQDVLLKVVRAIDSFRGDAALGSWIYRIAFNTAASRMRRTHARQRVETSWDSNEVNANDAFRAGSRQPPDSSLLADESVLRRQVRERFRSELDALPEIYRLPVELRDVRGLSTAEAGKVLGVTVQAVKSRLHRGRAILRSRLPEFRGGLTMHPLGNGRRSRSGAT